MVTKLVLGLACLLLGVAVGHLAACFLGGSRSADPARHDRAQHHGSGHAAACLAGSSAALLTVGVTCLLWSCAD